MQLPAVGSSGISSERGRADEAGTSRPACNDGDGVGGVLALAMEAFERVVEWGPPSVGL